MVLNLVHSTLFAILLSGVWLLDDVGNAEKIKQPNKHTHTHIGRRQTIEQVHLFSVVVAAVKYWIHVVASTT